MFIELDSDFINCVCSINKIMKPQLVVMEALFNSMLKGNHIVYASREDITKIISKQNLSQVLLDYLKWVLKKYVYIYSCKNSLKTFIIVTNKNNKIDYKISNNITKISVPYMFFIKENISKLLTENERDAISFEKITKYVYKKRSISAYYNINFEHDSFHGGNCKTKVEQVSHSNNMVISLVDSDMKYSGGKKGSTYKGLVSAVKQAQKNIPISSYVLPVREKENLIPISIYKQFTDNRLIHVIADYFENDIEIQNFFDLKEGVKRKTIDQADDKWKNHFNTLISKCEEKKIYLDKKENLKDDDKYIEGIGADLCDKIIDVLFVSEDYKYLKNKFSDLKRVHIEMIIRDKDKWVKNIPDYILHIWEQIADVLFDWGCCINVTKYPVIRNWGVSI